MIFDFFARILNLIGYFIYVLMQHITMNWLWIAIFLVAVYAFIAGYIKKKNLWEGHVTFYGPILAIKTEKVGFFDNFRRFTTFLRVYGTLGVVMVVIVSVFMTLTVLFAVQQTLLNPPQPEGIYALPNILAIPGINEFIPFTFAVWLSFILTLVVHEFGHAVLCRVEDIRVRSMGILFAVIPIGAFVEPEEEDVENTHGMSKVRMFGAGITNNIVIGLICFFLMVALLGMSSPQPMVYVKGIYQGSPADIAGIPPDSIILEINGTSVKAIEDVSVILTNTSPGDVIPVLIEHEGDERTYHLTLSGWPEPVLKTLDLLDEEARHPLPSPGSGFCSYTPQMETESEIPSAKIWISSVPSGAEIIVDGSYSGCVTNTTLILPSGNHELAVEIQSLGKSDVFQVYIPAYPDSGFMGVTFYNQAQVKQWFDAMGSGLRGLAVLIYAPVNHFILGDDLQLGLLLIDSPESIVWDVPFPQFWGVIQVLFWSAWFNIAVGTFNALPMVPLDGGYIMQESVTRFLGKRNLGKLVKYVVGAVSLVMLLLILSLIALPYLLNL